MGLLALALLLPLALALVNIFSDDDDGWFGNVLETWFLWSALEWPWLLLGGLFRAGGSGSGHTTAGDAASHAPATPESASDPALASDADVDDVAVTVNDVAVSGERRGSRRRQRRGRRRAPR